MPLPTTTDFMRRLTLKSTLRGLAALLLPARLMAQDPAPPVAAPAPSTPAPPPVEPVRSGRKRREGRRQAAQRRVASLEDTSVAQPQGLYASLQHEQQSVRQLRDVVYSSRPNAGGQSSSRQTARRESSARTLSLAMDIFIPPNATAQTPAPALIRIHGGGFKGGGKAGKSDEVMSFARAGYVGVNVNYRLTPANARSKELRMEAIRMAVEDVQNAIRFLRKNAAQYGIDSAKIVTVGGSAGGGISLANAIAANEEGSMGQSDFPGVSSRVAAAVSSGATLIDRHFDSATRLRFDVGDAPVLLFHASPQDPATKATWTGNVLPTQKLIRDSGNVCEVVATPADMHVVPLDVGSHYWPQMYAFLKQHLQLPSAAH